MTISGPSSHITPHFAWSEFECHDNVGTPYPNDWADRALALALELERIRTRIGPVSPTSVFRTWTWHKVIYSRMSPKQTPPSG